MALISRGSLPLEFFRNETAARAWLSVHGKRAAAAPQVSR